MTMDTANNPPAIQVGDKVRLDPYNLYPCSAFRNDQEKDFTVTEVTTDRYLRLEGLEGLHPVGEVMLSPVQKPFWQEQDTKILSEVLETLETVKTAATRSGVQQEMVSMVIGIFELKGVSDAVQAIADANKQVVRVIDEAMVDVRAYMKEEW